ncbi:MAG: sensor histidine kinase [Bryobacteraceae bacterium]
MTLNFCKLGRLTLSQVLNHENIRVFIRSGSGFFLAAAMGICGFGLEFHMDHMAFQRATLETQHIRSVLEANEETLSLLKDAETGQRGYLLTGVVEDLEPYANSQWAVLNSVAKLSRCLRAQMGTATRGEILNVLVSEKLEMIRRSIYLYDTVGPDAALGLVRTDHDRQLMNQIRLVCAALKTEGLAQLEASSRVLERTIDTSHWFVSFGSSVLVCLLLVASVIVRQETKRQIRLTDQLAASNDDLRRANVDLEQFAYVSSHDLQEPLRTVSIFTELLNKKLTGQLDENTRIYMQYIVSAAQRSITLVSGALQYAQVSLKRPQSELVDMERVFAEVLGGCGALIQETGAEITHDALPTVFAQSSQLAIVLENLLTNALKYRSQLRPKIHVHAQQRGRHWLFSVEDNGVGFDMHYSRQIFGLCKRLQSEVPGTGIGLAISKRIVENHGGEIWATSGLGKGSTFAFTLVQSEVANSALESR